MREDPPTTTPVFRPTLPPRRKLAAAIDRIYQTHMLSNFGQFAQQLESTASSYLDGTSVRSIVSCDIGLMAVFRALNLKPGGEVILPSFTFNSTANSVCWNGLRPYFADIDARTFCLDPTDVAEHASRRTVAILATHTFGCPAPIRELQEIADDLNVPLVFDAAHAYGSTYRSRKVGSFGRAEVFSLSGTKVVTSGEGGLVASNDRSLLRRIELIRGYGFLGDYNSRVLGLNGKISELNAAMGCLTLPDVDRLVRRRHSLVALYKRILGKDPAIGFQEIPRTSHTTYKDFAILLSAGRNSTKESLAARGIQTKTYFRPLHTSAYFRRHRKTALQNTKLIARRVLCLPLWNELPERTVERVASSVMAANSS